MTLPANTEAPSALGTGTDSPVTGLSSTSDAPSTTSPSAETRSPGRTRTRSPTSRLAAGTSRAVPSPSMRRAVLGTRAPSASMPARARPAATFSSSSPIVNRNTTTAASEVAPMRIAPTVAIDISISMENGEPARAAAIALRPKKARPSSAAGR